MDNIGERKKKIEKLQGYKKNGNQVRINDGWWKILAHIKADTRTTFKELVENALSNTYAIGEDGKPYEMNA